MFSVTENRVSRAIAAAQERIDTRLASGELSAEDLERLDNTLAVTFEEHFQYQEAQARAHVSGDLSTEEAQIVYIALGEYGSPANGGWAAETGLATKIAVTQLIGELLERRIKGRR